MKIKLSKCDRNTRLADLDMVMQNFLIVGLAKLQVVFKLLARQVIARLQVAPALTLLGEVVP